MGWLGPDGSSPDQAVAATWGEVRAVEELEERSGRPVRDLERLHWEGVWPFRWLERG